jgi:hypothetical protein
VGERAVTGPVFTLVGLPPDAAGSELLGVWAAVAPRPASGVAFAATPDDRWTADPVWRVDLAAEPATAEATLAAAEARVATAAGASGTAAERLLVFARRQAAGRSFAAMTGVDAGGSPERELAALLAEASEVPGVASYGVGDTLRVGWQEVTAWFATVVRAVLAPLDRLTTVETASGGVRVGRTTIGFTGGCDTFWRADIKPELAALHGRAVGLALATRAALVRTLALALRGAAVVAVAVGTPGGPLVALPAVWRFVTQVQAEAARIRQGFARGETENGQR